MTTENEELEDLYDWLSARGFDRPEIDLIKQGVDICGYTRQLAPLQSLDKGKFMECGPDICEYVDGYELRGDNGDYTPNKDEAFLIEDCLRGYLEEFVDDVCAKLAAPAVDEKKLFELLFNKRRLNCKLVTEDEKEQLAYYAQEIAQALQKGHLT